jgi:DNA repair exonuclease SbcCD ATPase subunit
MSDINLLFDNIGGLLGERTFTLKSGLNVVEAPNAEGKSSFVNGLLALVLPDDELRNARHLLNLAENSGRVRIEYNAQRTERRLTATNGSLSSSGTAFVREGTKVKFFAFATPDNPLFNLMQQGVSLEKTFEDLSDARYYALAIGQFHSIHERVKERLASFRGDEEFLIRLEKQISLLQDENVQLNKEKATLPKIDLSKMATIYETRQRISELIAERSSLKAELENAHVQIRNLQEERKQREREVEYFGEKTRAFSQKHPRFDEEIERIEKHIDETTNEKTSLESRADIVEITLGQIDRQVQRALELGVEQCFVCGRDLTVKQAERRRQQFVEEKRDLERQIAKFETALSDLKNDMETLEEERLKVKTDFEIRLKDSSNRMSRIDGDVKRYEKLLESGKTKLTNTQKKLGEIEVGIDKKALATYTRAIEIEETIKVKSRQADDLKGQIARLGRIRETLRQHRQLDQFLAALEGRFARRVTEIKDALKVAFNNRISEVYDRLGFRDFEKIEINPRYLIDVVRQGRTRVFKQPIFTLSTSERVTIGVIVMLAGKEQYLPDFPIFVLDELVTSYDPTRFKRIIEYVTERVPVTIVTKLAPTGELQVRHAL